ncbi:MAG: NAD(P)H-hydrate epimerase [Candidatus Omnitrophica bacterium]|nr:NAD(P)H-hydrate epimerase [Candidatus Omnitrophota bacterium]
MKVATAYQMKLIDRQTIKKYGIPSLILMENAAICSAFWALHLLKRGQKRVYVFCGQGNNGGDGFACARHLVNHGLSVKVYFSGKLKKLSQESMTNYKILKKMGLRMHRPRLSILAKELRGADLVIDALLGIGLVNNVRQPIRNIIEIINNSKKPVLSLDTPSGLNSTNGKVCAAAVKASLTVTFGLPKKGFFASGANRLLGRLVVCDISIPRALLK